MTTRKVKTLNDLLTYLNKPYWDCILVDAPIDVTTPIEINRTVRMMSTFRGYVKYHTYAPRGEHNDNACFLANVNNVFFEKFTLLGGDKQLTSSIDTDGLQIGIKFQNNTGMGKVDSCKIENFNWGGIWHFDSEFLYVLNNIITGPNNTYFNYATWQGGRGNAYDQKLYFINNRVNKVRHAVGASGHPNSYYALGNHIQNTIKHAFDRHNLDLPSTGGLHTVINGNIFYQPDRYAFSIESPYPEGSFSFAGNHFLERTIDKSIGEINGTKMYEGDTFDYNGAKCTTYGNKYKVI